MRRPPYKIIIDVYTFILYIYTHIYVHTDACMSNLANACAHACGTPQLHTRNVLYFDITHFTLLPSGLEHPQTERNNMWYAHQIPPHTVCDITVQSTLPMTETVDAAFSKAPFFPRTMMVLFFFPPFSFARHGKGIYCWLCTYKYLPARSILVSTFSSMPAILPKQARGMSPLRSN